MESLHIDWREWLRLLTVHRVKFVVVGAHALAAHGRPRLTGDLDVFVEPTKANSKRVLAALDDFGFGNLGLTANQFASPDKVTMLGRVPYRIDLITGIDGVSFRQAWRGRVIVDLQGLTIPVLGIQELLSNKRAAGRPKDLLDVALLEEIEEGQGQLAAKVRR